VAVEVSLMRRLAAFDRQWAASRTVIAALLATGAIAAPIVAQATGFNGMPTVASGGATFSTSGSVQTIQLNQTQTIINWAPTDAATSAAPIAFLDAGQTVSYTPQGVDLTYTVLNRILPTDATRAIGINGTINSAKNIRTWFYTPGGFLLGSNAVFNVGGLLLSVADIATTTNPSTGTVSFVTQTGAADQFSVAGIAGSQSAITIRAGAQINVATAGRSAYMVAIAPQISNAGTINVAGSTALVAAESASFAAAMMRRPMALPMHGASIWSRCPRTTLSPWRFHRAARSALPRRALQRWMATKSCCRPAQTLPTMAPAIRSAPRPPGPAGPAWQSAAARTAPISMRDRPDR